MDSLKKLLKKHVKENPTWEGLSLQQYKKKLKEQGIKNYAKHKTFSFYIGSIGHLLFSSKKIKCGSTFTLGKRISMYNQGGGNFLVFVNIEFYNKEDLLQVEKNFHKIWFFRNIKLDTDAKELYNFEHKEFTTIVKWIKTYCQLHNIEIKTIEEYK